MSALLYISMLGLNERKMPKDKNPSSLLHFEVEGLCFDSAQDVRIKENSLLAFMRDISHQKIMFRKALDSNL